MHTYSIVPRWATSGGRGRRRRLSVGCTKADSFSGHRPRIINPGNVASSGADAVRLGARPATPRRRPKPLLVDGLFADEYNNGDSFIARPGIDQRNVTVRTTF
jgi:hypothetical protein